MGKQGRVSKKNQTPLWILVAVLAVAVFVIGYAALGTADAPEAVYPAEISVAEAFEKREQGAYILDVRQPEEWEQGHIPDATLIPLAELPDRLSEVPADQEVVVVCRSGNRSAQARDILRSAGYTQVTSMSGGVTDWQAQGLPIITGP